MDIINAHMINQPNRDEVVKKGVLNPLKWTSRREICGLLHGCDTALSHQSGQDYSTKNFYKELYHSFGHCKTWNNVSGNHHHYGAVFNFDFSPDGSTLVAASERRSILMFDPLTHKMHYAKTNAHLDCVNVVKFIDSRLFATCSDDRTVKLWDLRHMSKETQTLTGHSNWVKNVEYISGKDGQNGKLLTSGFDGNIIMWDYDSYTEDGEVPHKVLFQTRNLMRTALSPDQSKLVMSTSSGYILVVHNFDVNTLADDLNGFKPNIYRLMQMNPGAGNSTIAYQHLFQENRATNRLELITDFTDNVDVEIIASLKIHPSGDWIVSRNTSSDEQTEHTCVHDLRDTKLRQSLQEPSEDEPSKPPLQATQYLLSLSVDNSSASTTSQPSDRPSRASRPAARRETAERSRSRSRSPITDSDRQETSSAGAADRGSDVLSRILPSAQQTLEGLAANYANTNDQFMIFIQGGSDGVHQTLVLFADETPQKTARRQPCHKDTKLTYYVEEPNMGRGFIKEPCFSHDGRIVCSPFAHGVRLLGYDSECSELEEKTRKGTKRARELQEIDSIYTHQNLVVATKYSPTHPLLVTGCLDGLVCFHQPVI